MRFDDVEVGERLPDLARVVTRKHVRAYAHASGDHNPLHQDDDVAMSAGFDGVIAHGMFTMGHMAACITRWAGRDASVMAISAQFRAPVPIGATLVAGGRVTSIDPDERTVSIESWVTMMRGDRMEHPIKRGAAVVRF